jgi:hypothetical protein
LSPPLSKAAARAGGTAPTAGAAAADAGGGSFGDAAAVLEGGSEMSSLGSAEVAVGTGSDTIAHLCRMFDQSHVAE